MKFQQRVLTAAAVTAAAVVCPHALALVSLEDGRDHLFIDGSVEMSYDSNIFAHAQSGGSLAYEGSLSTEFVRHAGWIGVNIKASLSFANFARYSQQNYVDPSINAELTKQTGRTTGSLTFSMQKINRADVDVNTRDVSWVYDAGLNFQYPVIERYSVSGAFDASHTDYLNKQLFTDSTAYSGSLYLYYVLNEVRDIFVDYRSRLTDEGNGQNELDNSLTAGVSGRVIGPFNGSLQVGYQVRNPTGGTPSSSGRYGDLNGSGTMTWNVNRRVTLTADLLKDFAVTANALSVDTLSGGLTLQDSLTSKAVATLDGSVGENRFLGNDGQATPGGPERIDRFISFGGFYSYAFNEHLKLQVGYSYYKSWSDVAYAEFPRAQYNLTLSSHW
jgi:hypothetical protein